MEILEYIRELGCEMENAMQSAIAQGMAESNVQDERHRTIQRNFIFAKIVDAQHYAERITSLLDDDEEFTKLESMRNSKSQKDAVADLLRTIEHIETTGAQKNITFARQQKVFGKESSDEAVERQFFHRLRMPIDIPNEHSPIVNGQFRPEETFGSYIDLQIPHKLYCNLTRSVCETVSLHEEEKEKLADLSYFLYISGIETQYNNFPQRVKYGAFMTSEALSEQEVEFLRSNFVPKYAAYLHQLGDECKRSHLKVFPLDVDLVESERSKFPAILSNYYTKTTYVIDKSGDGYLITAEFLLAAEERVKYWLQFLEEKIQATTRMLERRQILTPEEIGAEEERAILAMRKSLCTFKAPSWAYVFSQKDPLKAIGSVPEVVDRPKDEEKKNTQPEGVIPLWLRKLNGLSVRLFCQVCNQTYAGPAIFEQHFREFRHSQCLSRLGIINVPAMHGVDKIDEARKLWQKIITTRKRKRSFWTAQDMEFEDEFGEVVKRIET